MDDEAQTPVKSPYHDWGPLADDPFMPLGREDLEVRSVLKRLWTRSGGDEALFDALIPLDGPYGREPPESLGREPG